MDLKEALIALAEGKKVRKENWNKDEYVYLKNGKILTKCNYAGSCAWMNDGYALELYEEPQKPIDELKKHYNEWLKIPSIGLVGEKVIQSVCEYIIAKEKQENE